MGRGRADGGTSPPPAVAYYAVTARRIAAGRGADFLQTVEEISRSLAGARGRLMMRVYLSEADPSETISVSGWSQREAAAAAQALVDPGLDLRLRELAPADEPERWFV